MAGKTRKLTIEIVGEDRSGGKTFQGIAKDAKRAGDKITSAGKEAGAGFADKLKSEVSNVGSVLEDAGSTAGDLFSGGFDVGDISDTISGAFQGMSSKLGPVAAGAGAVVAGAFAVGLFNGFENEVATDKLVAQLGGGDWAEQGAEVASSLYLNAFGESMGETSEIVRAVMTSTLTPLNANEDAIYDIAEAAATFSDVMGQEVDGSVRAVDRMITSGLVPNAESGFDVLTTGLQTLGPAGDDLLDTFTEYSTIFEALGFDGETALGAINTLMSAGVQNTDKAADALKEFQIRAQDGSELTSEAFESLGLDADAMMRKFAEGGPQALGGLNDVLRGLQDIEDPVERNRVGVALFSTQWEDMSGAIAGADLSPAATEIEGIAGSTDDLGSAYDNASTKIEDFRRKALDKLTTFVGETVLPKLEALGKWAKENPVAFTVIAGIIGGALVLAFTAWAVSAALAAAATIAATWPILAVAAAVIGLAALVMIHKDTILGAFKAVWNWLSDNWPLLLTILFGPFGLAVVFIIKHRDKIWGAIKAVFNWLRDNWTKVLGFITGPIGLATAAVVSKWDTIKNKFTAVKDWIKDRVDDIVGFIAGLPGRVSEAASGMWDGISDAFKAMINRVIGWWNGISFTVGPWTIGGGSVGPIDIPSATIGPYSFQVPQVPTLGDGGIAKASAGGMLANIAEAGRDELVAPLPPGFDIRDMGGETNIYNDFRGAVISSKNELERLIVQSVNHAQAKGVTVKRRRSR